jgi:hypothetical protein
MIARIAFSDPVDDNLAEVRRENLVKRFKPALAKQPGLVGAFWMVDGAGNHVSLTLWESRQAMEEGGRAASDTPLLPGHRPDQLPSPRVEVYDVWERIDLRDVQG